MRVRNVECGMRNGRVEFNSAFRTPHSALGLPIEDRRLFGALRWLEAEVPVRARGGAATAGRAGEEALLHQERLVHLFQRARVLPDGGGDGAESDRPALELLDDRLADA